MAEIGRPGQIASVVNTVGIGRRSLRVNLEEFAPPERNGICDRIFGAPPPRSRQQGIHDPGRSDESFMPVDRLGNGT